MAQFDFNELKKLYENFQYPGLNVLINGKDVVTEDNGLAITGVDVEQTSGFEAGIVTLYLSGPFNPDSRSFDVKKTKQSLYMGSNIVIAAGYGTVMREIFRGFIARVHFIVPGPSSGNQPGIEIVAMDAKGLMMANRHSKKLKAKCYSEAVKEILSENVFLAQKDDTQKDIITLNISDTPDKQEAQNEQGTTDRRVEMVEESDYEFIVKAAKKFNFEFFIVGNNLYFIEAKKNTDILIELGPRSGLKNLDVGYDISGLVRSVEVRNIDMEEGKYVGGKKKSNTKISLGNKAKPLVDKQSLVYLDPTARSKEEAGYRAQYLMDTVDYRLGSIVAEYIGIPEIIPGRFITLKGFGSPIDNNFYITKVRHIVDGNNYKTSFEGCTNVIGDSK